MEGIVVYAAFSIYKKSSIRTKEKGYVMRYEDLKLFLVWAKGNGLDMGKMSVGVAAVYISHFKDMYLSRRARV